MRGGAPLLASSLCSEAQGDWSPLVAHPIPSGRSPGVRWANAFGFVYRKYHSSPMYFRTLRSPCSSLCFLHTTKMWSRVWRGTPHSHRCDSSILNRWKYDPIGGVLYWPPQSLPRLCQTLSRLCQTLPRLCQTLPDSSKSLARVWHSLA